MAITIACPKCQARFEITKDDLADQPIRCHRCEHTFRRGDANLHADAIQVGTGRKGAPAAVEVDEPMPPSRPHATARPPFPVVPLLILLCGLLFLLLVLSGGFNFWLIGHPDMRFDRDAEMQMLRAQADEAAARAAQAREQEVVARREVEDLKRRLDKRNQEFGELEHKFGQKLIDKK